MEETCKQTSFGFKTSNDSLLDRNELPGQNQNLLNLSNKSTGVANLLQGSASVVSQTTCPTVMLHHSTSRGSDSTVTASSPTFFEETDNRPCHVMIPALSQSTAPEFIRNRRNLSSASTLSQKSVDSTDFQTAYTCANFQKFSENQNNDILYNGSQCTTQLINPAAVTDSSLMKTQASTDITMQSNLPANYTISAVNSQTDVVDTQVISDTTLQPDQSTSIEIIFYPHSEETEQIQVNSSVNSLDLDPNTSFTSVLGTAVNNADSISHDLDENLLSENPTIQHILNNEPISNILDHFENNIEEDRSKAVKKKLREAVEQRSRSLNVVKSDQRTRTKQNYSKEISYCGLNFHKTCACSDSEDREEVPEDQIFMFQGQMYRLQEATVIKIGHIQMHAFLRNGLLYVPICMLWHFLDIDSQKHFKKAMSKEKGFKYEDLLENDQHLVKQKYNLIIRHPKQKMIDLVAVRALAKSIVTEYDSDIMKTLAYQPLKVKVCSSEMKCTQCGGTVSKANNFDDYVTLDLSSFQTEEDNSTQDFLNNKCENSLKQVDAKIGALYLHKTKFSAFELKNKIYISVKEFVDYKILQLETLQNKLEKLQYKPIIAPPEIENIFLETDVQVCKSLWMSVDKVIAVCKTSYSVESKRHDLLLHFTLNSFIFEPSIQLVASDTSITEHCYHVSGERSDVGVKVENTSVGNQISTDIQLNESPVSSIQLEQFESFPQISQHRSHGERSLQQTENNPYLNQDQVTLPEGLSKNGHECPKTEENNVNEEILSTGKCVTHSFVEIIQNNRDENMGKQTIEIENEVVLKNDNEYVNDSSCEHQDSPEACQGRLDIDTDKTFLVGEEEYIVQDIELFKIALLAGKVKFSLRNDPNTAYNVKYPDLLTKALWESPKYAEEETLERTLFGRNTVGLELPLNNASRTEVGHLLEENFSLNLAVDKGNCQKEMLRENSKTTDMTDTGNYMTDSSAKDNLNQCEEEHFNGQGKDLVASEYVVSNGLVKDVTRIEQDFSAFNSGKNIIDTDQSVLLTGEEYIVQDIDLFKNAVQSDEIKSWSKSDASRINTSTHSDPRSKLIGIERTGKYPESDVSEKEKTVCGDPDTSDTDTDHLVKQIFSDEGKHGDVAGNKSPLNRENRQQTFFESKFVNRTEFKTFTSPVKSPASRVEKICSKLASLMVPNSTNNSVTPLNMLATIATTEEVESDFECEAGNRNSETVVNSVSEQPKFSEEEKNIVEQKIKQFIVFAPRGKHLVVKRFKAGAEHAFPALFSPYPDHPVTSNVRQKFIKAVSVWVNAKFSGGRQVNELDGVLDITNTFLHPKNLEGLTNGENSEIKSKNSSFIGMDKNHNTVEQLDTVPCGDKGNKVSELCVDQKPDRFNSVIATPDDLMKDPNNEICILSKVDRAVSNSDKDNYGTTGTKDNHYTTDLKGNTAEFLDDSTGMEDRSVESMDSESILADCSSVSTSSCDTLVVGRAEYEKTAKGSEGCESQCESCSTKHEISQPECERCFSKCHSLATESESCSTKFDSSQTECKSFTSNCENPVTYFDSSGRIIKTGFTDCGTSSEKQSRKQITRKVKQKKSKVIETQEVIGCKTESIKDKDGSGHFSSGMILKEDYELVKNRHFWKKRQKLDENKNIREKTRGSKRLSLENKNEDSIKSNEDLSDIMCGSNVPKLDSESNADTVLTTENTKCETSQKSKSSDRITVKLNSSQRKHNKSKNNAFTKVSRLKYSKSKNKQANKKSATILLEIKKLSRKENQKVKQKDTNVRQSVKHNMENKEMLNNEHGHVEQVSLPCVIPRSKISRGYKLSTFNPNIVAKRKLNEACSELRSESTESESDAKSKAVNEGRSTCATQAATDNTGTETQWKGEIEIELTSDHIENERPTTVLTDSTYLRKARSEGKQDHKLKSFANSSKQIFQQENKDIEQSKNVEMPFEIQNLLCSNTENFMINKECSELPSSSIVKMGSTSNEKSLKRKALADPCYVKLKRIKFLDDIFKK